MLGLGNTIIGGAPPSEWTPADLSSLIHWYKFDTDMDTFYVAGAGNYVITQWSDQKGTNHLVDTMTPANSSAYNTAHPKQDQSTKELVFDHGGDQLDFTSSLSLGSFSVYMRLESDGSHGDFILETDSGDFLKIQAADEARFKVSGSRHDFALPADIVDNTKFNIGYERDVEGDMMIYLNGTAGTQDGTGDGNHDIDNTLDITKIGDPANTLKMTEMIICNDALSTADRALLQTYLSNIN